MAPPEEGVKGEGLKGKRRVVVDVAGLVRVDERNLYYTTPEVLDELRDEASKAIVEEKVRRGILIVREAGEAFLEKALSEAERTGDRDVLSKPDLTLLALLLELSEEGDAVLKTDDYALQNIASTLGLPVETILGEKIRERIKWRIYCKECGRFFPGGRVGMPCPECGAPLTRKAVHKRREKR